MQILPLGLTNVLPPRWWVGKVRARVSFGSFGSSSTGWIKWNANNQLSITQPSLLAWRSLHVVDSSGFNLVEPWWWQVGEMFTNSSFSLQNHSWGGLTLIYFSPCFIFPQFGARMRWWISLQQIANSSSACLSTCGRCLMIPFLFGGIRTTINHTAVIFGFAATGCTPFLLANKLKSHHLLSHKLVCQI